MVWHVRNETLIAQHIEVALVYKDMLGVDEALNYLARESIPPDIAERVLLGERKRRSDQAPGAGSPAAVAHAACRRRNGVHDAIVEAALKIDRKLGPDFALALLQDEGVPPAVVDRFCAAGPRQLRARKTGQP